jgi:hypothetical protein
VDDVVGAVTADDDFYDGFIGRVEAQFKIKEGELSYCLGLEIDQAPDLTVTVQQTKFIADILERFNMLDCKPRDTPLPVGATFLKMDGPAIPDKARIHLYRQMIGSLNWLACATRPDISLAVSLASQVMENPNEDHVKLVRHIFRYLAGTPTLGLHYGKGDNQVIGHCDGIKKRTQLRSTANHLSGWSDSDWAGCPETRLSHSGNVFMLNGGPISWMSKKQNSIALSSTEAELVALHHAAAEAMWLREILAEMDVPQLGPTRLYEDNSGCVRLTQNHAKLTKTKHVAVKYFFTRQQVEKKIVTIIQCGTKDQLADIFTKVLKKETFFNLREAIMGE